MPHGLLGVFILFLHSIVALVATNVVRQFRPTLFVRVVELDVLRCVRNSVFVLNRWINCSSWFMPCGSRIVGWRVSGCVVRALGVTQFWSRNGSGLLSCFSIGWSTLLALS